MAKISSCYTLCPLIDQRSFLGVSEDSVTGCVIVTLGKNIIIKFKLSDQKQVSSWSSKHKLSAPVVFDATGQQYVGVCNANLIVLWEDSKVQLNKPVKFKFTDPIECVLVNKSLATPVVVYKSGHALPLNLALDSRKEPSNRSILNSGEIIEDCCLITLNGVAVVAIFTKQIKKGYRLHLVPLEDGVITPSCLNLERITGESLIGYSIVAQESCSLLTMWSDGLLFSLDLPTASLGDNFPGRVLTNLSAVSPRHQIAILPLNATHIAVYGADPSEEGALLLIVNIQLCVVQCKQLFKLYTTPPRLWLAGTNSLLFVVGQHLTVAPYYLGKQRLAALVASNITVVGQQITANWENKDLPDVIEEYESKIELKKEINRLLKEGHAQSRMCEIMFPVLLSSKKIDDLFWFFRNFSDIPVSCFVSTIVFCLQDLEHRKRKELLQEVLLTPITTDIPTLQQLRNGISLELVLTLFNELSNLMIEFPANLQLLEWTTLFLDAHYQRYLLSKNEAVIEQLNELKKVVDYQMKEFEVWQSLEPILVCLKNNQGFQEKSSISKQSYSIEQLRLY
uniref:Nucleolar protein 11 n=2 Tax=Clastoptera arizonana TaxID=38151 RepID=A0A1B6DGP0_9HEMI